MIDTKLAFGASWLVPDTASAAWGARLIVTQSGLVDAVPNRVDVVGSEAAKAQLLSHLMSLNLGENDPQLRLSAMLKSGEVQTGTEREVTVYEDEVVTVRGNTNGSCGYFYMAAWVAA